MKTIKQILESHNIKEGTLHQNHSYLYVNIVKAMKDFGRQSFLAGCDTVISDQIEDEPQFMSFDEHLKQLEDDTM